MDREKDITLRIESMRKRVKGKYLTQAVAFNKDCPRQMKLLKLALEDSASFSGLVKELLAMRYLNSNPAMMSEPAKLSEEPPPLSESATPIQNDAIDIKVGGKRVYSTWV